MGLKEIVMRGEKCFCNGKEVLSKDFIGVEIIGCSSSYRSSDAEIERNRESFIEKVNQNAPRGSTHYYLFEVKDDNPLWESYSVVYLKCKEK